MYFFRRSGTDLLPPESYDTLIPRAGDPEWVTSGESGVEDCAEDCARSTTSLESLLAPDPLVDDVCGDTQRAVTVVYWWCVHVGLFFFHRLCAYLLPQLVTGAARATAVFLCEGLDQLVVYATASACMARVTSPTKRVLLFGSPARCAVFGVLTCASGLAFDLASAVARRWTAAFYGGVSAFAVSVLGGLCFHVTHAHARGCLKPYLVPRVGLAAFYAAVTVLAAVNGERIHLHQALLCWYVSLWCSFNHPVSLVTLSVSTGIFIQGVATGGASTLFETA